MPPNPNHLSATSPTSGAPSADGVTANTHRCSPTAHTRSCPSLATVTHTAPSALTASGSYALTSDGMATAVAAAAGSTLYVLMATDLMRLGTAPGGSGQNSYVGMDYAEMGGASRPTLVITYTAGGGPVVTSLSVTSGPVAGGTSTVITGSGFTAATAVHFGGANAPSYTVNNDTTITVTSPPGIG